MDLARADSGRIFYGDVADKGDFSSEGVARCRVKYGVRGRPAEAPPVRLIDLLGVRGELTRTAMRGLTQGVYSRDT